MRSRAIVIGLVLATTAPVVAQPAGAQAETLFRQAKDLMAKKKFAEACDAFAASQKLDAAISTLLNLADCREKNNQLATAWGLFLEAERGTRTDPGAAQLHSVALARSQKLEARLSTLTINVAAPASGLAITRNADAVESGAWNHKLPIDGGSYTIVAKAPGRIDWSTKIVVATEADTKAIEVPALAEASTTVVEAAHREPPPPPPSHHRSRALPIALAVGAGVLGAGAIGFEVLGRNTYDKSLAEMADQAHRTSLWQSANHQRYVAEGLAVAGLASASIAIWLFVRGGHDEAATTTALIPVVTPNGLALDGRF